MPNKLADKFLVSQTSEDVKEHVFEISLGGPARMIVKSVKDMLSVKFVDAPGYYFENSVGLMGSYPTGDRVARDGKTILSDPNAFGQEWQVISDEPQLFMATRSPQHPQKCFLPDAKMKQSRRGRRLGEYIHREAAAKACAEWKEAEREACIYDVLATGDFEIAKAGGF